MRTALSLNISALKVVIPYFLIASIWIFFSDRLLNRVMEETAGWQTYKGLFFVLATSILLYIMVSRTIRRLRLNNKRIRRLLEREKNLRRKTQQTTRQLKEAVEDKEVLLRELHHRVKNNLAVVAGLIDLQAGEMADDKAVIPLKSTQSRIHAIANIHKLLHREQDLKNISVSQLIEDLSEKVFELHQPSNVTIRVDIQDLLLNVNQAMPLGLLLNELFSLLARNASGKNLELLFAADLSALPEITLQMEVRPSGNVVPAGFTIQEESLEYSLIHLLLKQFGAEINSERTGELTKIQIHFTKEDKRGSASNL